ncbi:hypothetical protein [Actinomadura sp. 21ATH]|uniref:hypothetical protein n=1 Tax=Actinomadura sp. 21ATH TaxID=1735444 RepID=UPI0035BEBE76
MPPPPVPPAPSGPPAPSASGPPAPAPATVLGLRARQWMAVAAALAGCYLMTSGVALTGSWALMNREPTNAELQQAALAEVARRWQVWPAGRIFPERVAYSRGGGESEFATRVGIAPQTACDTAVDQEYAPVLRRHGCRGVLRATYTDQLQGVVVTVGVAAFPDQWKADKAFRELPPNADPDRSGGVRPAVRAAAFPGTAAARFTDAARQERGTDRGGPYVMLTTAGYADGRPAEVTTKKHPARPFLMAPQVARGIARPLSTQSLPDCSSREWRC